jgi:hypothetical protein
MGWSAGAAGWAGPSSVVTWLALCLHSRFVIYLHCPGCSPRARGSLTKLSHFSAVAFGGLGQDHQLCTHPFSSGSASSSATPSCHVRPGGITGMLGHDSTLQRQLSSFARCHFSEFFEEGTGSQEERYTCASKGQ